MKQLNILLIRLSSIGDVLHCTPLAKTLKLQFPQANISWLVGEASQDILHGNPYLDEIIVWQREKWERELRGGEWLNSYRNFRLLEYNLRKAQYDLVIDMHGLLLTGLIAWRSGAAMRIGFAQAREGSPLFYTHRVPAKQPMSIVRHYLQLLQPLKIHKHSLEMVMPVAQRDQDYAEDLFTTHHLRKDDLIVALNPSTSWVTKCWPPDHFSSLADLLITKLKAKVILLGAASDQPLVHKIMQNSQGDIINLAGKTNLKELAAVVQKINLFIGGDTGPLHIAAAVGTPTISLFGPTDPGIYAPAGSGHTALFSSVPCRYCHRRTCTSMVCMEAISPIEVYKAAKQMFERPTGNKKSVEAVTYEQVPVKKIYSPL